MPPSRDLDHNIDLLPGSKPISKPAYRLSHSEVQEVERQLAKYVEKGFIRSSSSPWAAPILLVKKKDRVYANVHGLSITAVLIK